MDYKVKDISLSGLGRKAITLAEIEMPGLMELRRLYGDEKPLLGARIAGSMHMTVQTAVLIETLAELGAEVRWASCNINSTEDHAAAASVERGVSVFAWKGESDSEYDWCLEQTLFKDNEWWPNLILDDGGDLVSKIHNKYECHIKSIIGATEETTTGVLRYRKMLNKGELKIPILDINNSVTKSKFDNTFGCRESLIDGLKRATDIMIAGKTIVICGYGHVGKGCAQSIRGLGGKVVIVEIDPICALQALMEGYEVKTLDQASETGDIFITATGNTKVIDYQHLVKMKDGVILFNIGHFDNEINIKSLLSFEWKEVKPLVDCVTLPSGNRLIVLAKGRVANLACATGHSSFVMSISYTNQVLAQLQLWSDKNNSKTPGIYRLSKEKDEWIASIHLSKLDGSISKLTEEQAEYMEVNVSGPFKNELYTY